ncbi:MAG TPA: hypothetical protein VG184_02710, partial [Acidimicrobiales bacterium]|nr:hypothetical protein [Acidimicrobiales bacterium]
MPETGSPTSRRHARRHNSSRAAALFAVVVGLATVGLVAPSGAAALAAGTVVATGQVVALPAAEVVSVPGRTLPDAVAGYGFVAKVADGFVAHAGSGASELSA